MYSSDFGQFGGVHATPEVKICLHTKFEVNRRELERNSTIENCDLLVVSRLLRRAVQPDLGQAFQADLGQEGWEIQGSQRREENSHKVGPDRP